MTKDTELVIHLISMHFAWHYPHLHRPSPKPCSTGTSSMGSRAQQSQSMQHCSSLLVNAMLALGCHFTNVAGAFAIPEDTQNQRRPFLRRGEEADHRE